MIKRFSRYTIVLYLLLAFMFAIQVYAEKPKINKYFAQADREILRGEYDKAIEHYFEGLFLALGRTKSSKRGVAEVWDDLGYAFMQTGDLQKVMTYLKKSLSEYPENYNPRLYLAVVYLLKDEIDSAARELEKIEKGIYFDDSWMRDVKGLRKRDGKETKREELELIKNEKGIFLEKKKEDEIIVHLDAFDERNEGAFYYTHGIVFQLKEEFEKAEQKFFLALKAGYNEIEVRLKLAEVYLMQNLFNEAERELNKIMNRQKDHAEALLLKEYIDDEKSLRVSELPDKINIKLSHRLKNHDNDVVIELHNKFFEILKKGKIKESVAVLDDALDVKEQSFVVNHNLALICYDVAKLEDINVEYLKKAEVHCGRALWFKDFYEVNIDNIISCHDLMGNIYYYQKKYEKAQREFQKVLEFDPYDASTRYNLGKAYYELKDIIRAEQEWKKALESERRDVESKKEKAPEDELKFAVVVAKKPISYKAHMSLAMLYLEQGLNDKALEQFKKAIAVEPDHPEPYFELGKLYHLEDDKKNAIDCYEKYLYLGGKEVESINKLLKSLKKDNRVP
jgi:tetratricopeptide (TPR) repeat protein